MSDRFYMDVHVPFAITAELKLRGVDVLTSQVDSTTQLEDAALLARATDLRARVVLARSGLAQVRKPVADEREGLRRCDLRTPIACQHRPVRRGSGIDRERDRPGGMGQSRGISAALTDAVRHRALNFLRERLRSLARGRHDAAESQVDGHLSVDVPRVADREVDDARTR